MTTQSVSLDDNLIKQIEIFKSENRYETNSQAINELLRAGLEYLAEQKENEYLLALAEDREKNDNGVRYSFEDVLAESGMTIEDIDRMLDDEDVELEYELPC